MPSPPDTAVLHVALNPVTGPWSVMRELARAQADSGYYATVGIGVITSRDWPALYAEELAALHLPSYRRQTLQAFGTMQFLWQRLFSPPIGRWIGDLMARSGACRGVVHFHNAWMSGVFLPLRYLPLGAEIRVVATFHGMNAQLARKPIRALLHRRFAARLRPGVALTSVDAGNVPLIERTLGLPAAAFRVVPNGVPQDTRWQAQTWDGAGEFLVGHVGSITERKGWRLAADAVLRLRAGGRRIRLLVAGAGEEQAAVRALAAQHPEAIEFLGHVKQPRQTLMPRLHALTAMSAHEGLPMTILEAMSVGLPTVATAVGGIPEAVIDGRSGLLVPRTAEALAASLATLHDQPARWKMLSIGAREEFAARFELGNILRQYHELYCDPLAL